MEPRNDAFSSTTVPAPATERLDIAELRRRLRAARGPHYWRSFEELAATPEFEELVQREFPRLLPTAGSDLSRRRFLQLMGASLALAGLNACGRQPLEKIVPYVKQPEEIVPGKPLYFASSLTSAGVATGVLVESHLGRPTKIEGNPEHPGSLGATDVITQAAILSLYDPDRSQAPEQFRHIRSWKAFLGEFEKELDAQRALGGEGLRILSEPVVAPLEQAQRREFLERYPNARWVQYEPAGRSALRDGNRLAFGEACEVVYDLSKADVVLSLDADFLTAGPGAVRYARDFMARRKLRSGPGPMSRLYAVESTPSSSGTVADHRWSARAGELEFVALAVAARLGVGGVAVPAAPARPELVAFANAVADDLARHRGRSAVLPGLQAAPEIHVLAAAINELLDNRGHTVLHIDALDEDAHGAVEQLRALVGEMDAGKVDVLFVLGGNPIFDAPAELGFLEAFDKVPKRVHLGLYKDETSEYCHWHLPQSHPLESWGDGRAFDGTLSLQQPLLEPLYDGRTNSQLVALLLGQPQAKDDELLREFWRARHGGLDFDGFWRRSLHDGFVADSTPAPRARRVEPVAVRDASARLGAAVSERSTGLRVLFRPDPNIEDGRGANNAWLQECPKPLTRLTWDNAALIAPALAEEQGLGNGDVIELSAAGDRIEMPVWILPGQPRDSITVHLGYGRRRGGHVAEGCGVDVYPLRRGDAMWTRDGVAIRATGARVRLACTQDHHSMEGRELVRAGTLADYEHDHDFVHAHGGHGIDPTVSFNEGFDYSDGYAWGLTVDLGSCTGCNACVVACQAENNIPVVGKDEVLNGREMHWIRIDRYFEGELDEPEALNQPVMCMHCEQAPCEIVCPVAATVHSDEGLNDMVYNRCVGTRYCSNNCPYKVRRFNFYEYNDNDSATLKMQRNPDVTVRMRGVMEKCTYCVQRINHARIDAKKEGRPIRDGEVTTACQQVCPSQAIVFGDINDEASEVAKTKADPLNYGILTELGTRPRTSYLAKLSNPNPDLQGS